MTRALILVTVLVLTLTGCGQSRLNPFNWFGKSRSAEPIALYAPPADSRDLIDHILAVQVEPTTGGVILRATGLPPTQGYYNASLVSVADTTAGAKPGQLIYEFRVKPPATPAPAGTEPSREITVAISISNFQLQDITGIEVRGAQNAMRARR